MALDHGEAGGGGGGAAVAHGEVVSGAGAHDESSAGATAGPQLSAAGGGRAGTAEGAGPQAPDRAAGVLEARVLEGCATGGGGAPQGSASADLLLLVLGGAQFCDIDPVPLMAAPGGARFQSSAGTGLAGALLPSVSHAPHAESLAAGLAAPAAAPAAALWPSTSTEIW